MGRTATCLAEHSSAPAAIHALELPTQNRAGRIISPAQTRRVAVEESVADAIGVDLRGTLSIVTLLHVGKAFKRYIIARGKIAPRFRQPTFCWSRSEL